MGVGESREAQEYFLAQDLMGLMELTKTQAKDAFEEMVVVFPDEENVQALVKYMKAGLDKRAVLKNGYLSFAAFFDLLRASPVWADKHRKANFAARTQVFRDSLRGSRCGWLIMSRPAGKMLKVFARGRPGGGDATVDPNRSAVPTLRFYLKLGAQEWVDWIPLRKDTQVSVRVDNDKKFMVVSDTEAVLCTAQSAAKTKAWSVRLSARRPARPPLLCKVRAPAVHSTRHTQKLLTVPPCMPHRCAFLFVAPSQLLVLLPPAPH